MCPKKQGTRNWYRNALCKLHFDMHTPEVVTEIAAKFDPEEFIRRLKVASPDAICFFAKSAFGWSHYPTKVGAMHPHLKQDLLGEAVRVAHREGIRLIAYYCIEVLPPPIAQAHPDYLMRNRDGSPVKHHERFIACMNSPVQKELLLPQLKEILENYDVDGIFFDGFPAMHQVCYCEHCRRVFGEEIPTDAKHPAWRRFLAWQQKKLDNWCTQTGAFIHATRPGTLVGVNYLSANRYAAPAPSEIDYLTADYPVSDNCAIWTSYQLAAWCWRKLPCDVMNARMLHWWSDYTCRPSTAIKTEYAAAVARCSSVFLGDLLPPETSLPDIHVMELARDGFDFVRARHALIKGARPIADIALINGTVDHLLHSAQPNRDESGIRGGFLTAAESGLTIHILLDDDLDEHLRDYKVVFLCEIQTLKSGVCNTIRQFVQKGGGLVVCGAVPEGEDGDSLTDVLGVTVEGESQSTCGYMRVPDEAAHQFWPAWETARPWVLVHGRHPLVTAKGNAKIVAPLVLPGAKFQIGAQAPGEMSQYGALFLNMHGKGRAVYSPLPLASDYFKRANSGAKYILSGMLKWALPMPTVEVKSDVSLEVTLAKRRNAFIVHLLSYHAERRAGNPPVVERIPPVQNINVSVRLDERPRSVRQLPEGRSLKVRFKNGVMQIVVPQMHIHTALVIEG